MFQNFHPMATPIQPYFTNPPPQRPIHHQNQASIHLAAAGIRPPPNYMTTPLATPLATHFARPSIALPQQQLQQPPPPFPGRSRRQLSIGGPPKAVLGGPTRKLSPLPPGAQGVSSTSTTPAPEKKKKVVVNLPKGTIEWARHPLSSQEGQVSVPPVQITTANIFPPDSWRVDLPDIIDVYLPGKMAWETIKRKDIEDKLEKLGVERGSGSNVPHIHAPHARAASISSPADPALLLFKLNKLQAQQQEGCSTSNPNSLSVSPQIPFGLSPSPHRMSAANRLGHHGIGLAGGHGHTLSLAQPLSYSNSSLFSNSPSPFNGSNGVVENEFGRPSAMMEYNPPPLSAVGAPAHLDFIRGFGLDVPLESEEEGEEVDQQVPKNITELDEEQDEDADRTQDMDLDADDHQSGRDAIDDATTATGGDSRLHSRHVSRISVALSFKSFGGNFHENLQTEAANGNAMPESEEGEEELQRPVDPADEWTGSEDAEPSEDESIGTFSNPSDEERARQQRNERRIRRRAAVAAASRQQEIDQPRRIPEFPRPPDNTLIFQSLHHNINGRENNEDDIISNPSEENLIMSRRADFLGVTTESYYPEGDSEVDSTSVFGGMMGLHDHHSRIGSGGQYSAHDPALAHSRRVSSDRRSSQRGSGSGYHHHHHRQLPSGGGKRETLNPFAKPFVFGTASSVGPGGGADCISGGSGSGTWQPFKGEATPPMPIPAVATHSRMPSFGGKPLSAAAPEFKPGQFNFRLPPGAPQMPSLPPPPPPPTTTTPQIMVAPSPLPPLSPLDTSSPFRVQGREKRQRTESSSSPMLEEGNSMTSFKFPPPPLLKQAASTSPLMGHKPRHRSGSLDLDLKLNLGGAIAVGPGSSVSADAPAGGTRDQWLNPSSQTFTFAGFSAVANNMPSVPKSEDSSGTTVKPRDEASGEQGEDLEGQDVEIPPPPHVFASASKPKRAPIPLDFKHPSNTVPAGLFKALASNGSSGGGGGGGEERTRRSVRSRLNSREIFEHMHNRPSMDDTNIALIARKASRNRLMMDSVESGVGGRRRRMDEVNDNNNEDDDDDDVFTSVRPHVRRRSSLPDALVDNDKSVSPPSVSSQEDGDYVLAVGPQDLTTRMELHRVESVIEQLLDEKLAPIRAELASSANGSSSSKNHQNLSELETTMADLISLFQTQMRDSAVKSLEDSQMDARGELDIQLIKDMIEQSHQEILATFQREVVHRMAALVGNHNHNGPLSSSSSDVVVSAIDNASKRTVNAIVEAISEFFARQEAISQNAPSRERDLVVEKLVNVLSPMIESLHTDPIDYEFLTRELAQAVKPHISQLIDLASDKRETAGLIVDRILPLLPTTTTDHPDPIDTDAITLKLITEVRRAIAPIDAFEIKEQVADLVVERLDSRLAVRDKTFNVDVVTSKVTESVSGLVEKQFGSVPKAMEEVLEAQKGMEEKQEAVVAIALKEIQGAIADVPGQMDERLERLKTAQDSILEKLDRPTSIPDPDPNIFLIRNALETLEKEQKNQVLEAFLQSKVFADKLDAIPETLTTLVSGLRETLTELIKSHHDDDNNSKQQQQQLGELEELRKLNTEFQVQMTKVRVEKDALNEKLVHIEKERDRLCAKVDSLEASASVKATETSTLEARNAELEDALAKALSRLQAADVAAQADHKAIADLEKMKKEVGVEKESLKAKVAALEVEVGYANREKETVTRNLEAMHDQMISQQSHWDALNAASEKINMVYRLLENADEEDQQELRQQRERSRALEAENAALQKRLKDLDLRLGTADKTASAALSTLTQAQQRSAEWELRAKEYEGRLERVQTKLEQAEQTHDQLETDYSLVKVQIEECEADKRLVQDRENKQREQIAALEAKCIRLQNELEKADNAMKLSASSSTSFRPYNSSSNDNGAVHHHHHHQYPPPPPRPDSRLSTAAYDASAKSGIASVVVARNNNVTSKTQLPAASSSSSLTSTSASQQPSVWDSMHAPSSTTAKWVTSNSMHIPSSVGRYPNYVTPSTPTPPPPSQRQVYNQRRGPSPTPSVASVAPTMREDGWWS